MDFHRLYQLRSANMPIPNVARQDRASEARSPAAGGAEASGIEARMGRDREPGSIHESPVLALARRRHVTLEHAGRAHGHGYLGTDGSTDARSHPQQDQGNRHGQDESDTRS